MTLGDLPVGSLVRDPGTKYYGQPIVWRCVDKNHEGYPENSVTLRSDCILCLKCFDAKESDNTDVNRARYGNNRYSYSNIMRWANSENPPGQWYSPCHSVDTPPSSENVLIGNPYEDESGFLYGFSPNMLDALMNTVVVVAIPEIDGGGYENVESKIFLPSNTELHNFPTAVDLSEGSALSGYSIDGSSRMAYPTSQAVENSDYQAEAFNSNVPWQYFTRTIYSLSEGTHSVVSIVKTGSSGGVQAAAGNRGFLPFCNIPTTTPVSSTPDSEGIYALWPFSGKALGEVPAGTIVKIRENGVLADFKVAQHNYIQSGVTAIERDLCLADTVAFNEDGVNTYEGGTLDTFLTDTYRIRLDQDVRDALVSVDIPVTPGNGDYTLTTISRSVFVFSGTENGFSQLNNMIVEGNRNDIYTDNLSRIKYSDDAPTTAQPRWTRSANTNYNAVAWRVSATGTAASSGGTTGASYLAPALTLPSSSVRVSDDGELIFEEPPIPSTGKPFYFGGIDNTPHKVTSVFVGIDGAPRRIIKGFVGDENNVPRLFYSYGTTPAIKPFADYTWAEIKEIADAGLAQKYFKVGDEKPITLNDGSENVVQIVDFYKDIKQGTEGNRPLVPMTLRFKYLLPTAYQMNRTATNVGGHGESELWTTVFHPSNSTSYVGANFPRDLYQQIVSQVRKQEGKGGGTFTADLGVYHFWPPAAVELWGDEVTNVASGEGEQYKLFENESNRYMTKYGSDERLAFWTRSPDTRNSTSFFCGRDHAGLVSSSANTNERYVPVMFCI